jgi:hypothetical protein
LLLLLLLLLTFASSPAGGFHTVANVTLQDSNHQEA